MPTRRTPTSQPFSRLPVPTSHGPMQPVVSDIYDKLSIIPSNLAQQFQTQFDALKAQITNATNQAKAQAGTAQTVVPASGGGGGVIPVPPTPPSPGDITVIVDTFANRDVNYPVSSYAIGTLYVTNDRQAIYYNSSLAWTLVSGMGFGVVASRLADLGVSDSGYVWYATDLNSISVWDGANWIVISTQSVLVGTHGDRISSGAGTVAGSTLTATTGLAFQSYWVGNKINIGGILYLISVVTDSTHLNVIGTPVAGVVAWYFSLFPATNYPRGEVFIETDRQVMYTVGVGSGTCDINHFLVSWVSGPFFSGYWIGQTITINGVNYVVGTATQTSIGLNSDSGLVTSGLSWVVPSSVWYYEVGTFHAGTSFKPTDLNPYSDVGFEYHDTTIGVQYFGVHETAYSSTVLYFAWMSGTESMSYSTFSGRTWYASDNGLSVDITDYDHTLIWNGTGWRFTPGDGSKYFIDSDSSQPNGGVWQLCDGSTVNVLIITAGVVSLLSFTTPNVSADTFFRGGAYTGSVDPTSAPVFSAGGLTFTGTPGTPTGTNSVPTFTSSLTNSNETATHTHSGTTLSPTGTESIAHTHTNGATANAQPFASGSPIVVPLTLSNESINHTHTIGGSTGVESATHTHTIGGTGAVTAPTWTGNPFTPAGTISGTGAVSAPIVGAGAPRSIAFQRYLRR